MKSNINFQIFGASLNKILQLHKIITTALNRDKMWGSKNSWKSKKLNEGMAERTLKKGWHLISSDPRGPEPNLLWGSFTSNFRRRSWAKGPMMEGNGGSQRRMRLPGTESNFNSGKYVFITVVGSLNTVGAHCEYLDVWRKSLEVCLCAGETHLDTSLWEFLSPSRVNGEAPVNSSNIRIPKLHQSTAYRRERKELFPLLYINHNLENLSKACK